MRRRDSNDETRSKKTHSKHSKKRQEEAARIQLETTQDMEKLEREMLEEMNERNDRMERMEESFEKKKLKQITEAERILQESKRDASSRERFFTQRHNGGLGSSNGTDILGGMHLTEQKVMASGRLAGMIAGPNVIG